MAQIYIETHGCQMNEADSQDVVRRALAAGFTLAARPEDAAVLVLNTCTVRDNAGKGRTAVAQARLVLLVMINVAQLWILAATVEAALARNFKVVVPLIAASGVCWLVMLIIMLWWRPVSRRYTSTGYISKPSS